MTKSKSDLLVLLGHGIFYDEEEFITLPKGVMIDFFCEDLLGLDNSAADSMTGQFEKTGVCKGITKDRIKKHHVAPEDWNVEDKKIKRYRYEAGQKVRNYTLQSIYNATGNARNHHDALKCINVKTTDMKTLQKKRQQGVFGQEEASLQQIIDFGLRAGSSVGQPEIRIEWFACRAPCEALEEKYADLIQARRERIRAEYHYSVADKGLNAALYRDKKVLLSRAKDEEDMEKRARELDRRQKRADEQQANLQSAKEEESSLRRFFHNAFFGD